MGKQNKYKGIFLYLFGSQGYFRSSKITGPGLTAVVSNMTNSCAWPNSGWLFTQALPRPLGLPQHQGSIDAEEPDVRGGGA